MRFARFAYVRVLALEGRDLGGAQRGAALHQPIPGGPIPPIQLIDGPRYDSRLLESLDVRRVGAAERFRQRVPRGGELAERQLIEVVDLSVECHVIVEGSAGL
jgi:hypothetical protein